MLAAMASLDPVAYVRATPPFDALPAARFEEASRALDIAYYPAGSKLVTRGGEPLQHLYVIRKGAVRLERAGETLQVLEEGEIFGYTSLITKQATIDVVVEEDLLAYRLPGAVFASLLGEASFAGHFATGLAERLKSIAEQHESTPFQAELTVPVGTLVRRPPVRVPATATVGEAARVMRDERVGSVLVDAEPPGILTERHFRDRVLAAGLGPDTPVTQVFAAPLRPVPARTAIYEVWQTLLDEGVRHFAVAGDDGAIVGVLSTTDLLRTGAQGPVAVLRRVERLPSRDALPGYGDKVAEMASALVAAGLEATVIAGFVARLNDSLLARTLRWAEDELGPAPCTYAWIAFGSEGRQEQTLLTDQDNALVYEREGEAERRYFSQLAERANRDLESAGFPKCAGGYMARHWHGPLVEWRRRFEEWTSEPKPQFLLNAAIFFDFRSVHGELDLQPLHEVVLRAKGKRVFLQSLAKAALEFRPPASLILRLRGDQVDLKLHAISPIVFLARCYAVEAGTTVRNTQGRLDAAVRAGLIGEDVRATLREAHRFLLGLRLRQQLRMIEAGEQPVNLVALSQLSTIERSRLKDSMRAIANWQETAAYHYRTDLF
jgi:CBS domain-containing protein